MPSFSARSCARPGQPAALRDHRAPVAARRGLQDLHVAHLADPAAPGVVDDGFDLSFLLRALTTRQAGEYFFKLPAYLFSFQYLQNISKVLENL